MSPTYVGLYLLDPGPDRGPVLLRVRQVLSLRPAEAKARVDSGKPLLLRTGLRDAIEELARCFTDLGAHVELRTFT